MSSTHKTDCVDTAIADLHAWRRELNDRFNGDLNAIVEDAIKRQHQSGRRIIHRREPHEGPAKTATGLPADG